MKGALVTGGARRIGRAIALGLAADGWHVAVHHNSSSYAADETVAAIKNVGGHAVSVQADLSDPQACGRLVAEADEATGGLTCLVNNASVFLEDDIATADAVSFDAAMAVNLRAPMLLSQAFAACLPEGEDGVILNILDQKLNNPNPDFLSYTLSKCGLAGMTEILAMALGPSIRVCAISPGLTMPSGDQREEQFRVVHGRTPLGRGSAPEDVAGAVRYLVGAHAVTGETILVDGGQHLVGSTRDVMFLDPSQDKDETA